MQTRVVRYYIISSDWSRRQKSVRISPVDKQRYGVRRHAPRDAIRSDHARLKRYCTCARTIDDVRQRFSKYMIYSLFYYCYYYYYCSKTSERNTRAVRLGRGTVTHVRVLRQSIKIKPLTRADRGRPPRDFGVRAPRTAEYVLHRRGWLMKPTRSPCCVYKTCTRARSVCLLSGRLFCCCCIISMRRCALAAIVVVSFPCRQYDTWYSYLGRAYRNGKMKYISVR